MLSREIVLHKLKAGLISLIVFSVFSVILFGVTWHYWYPGYLFWLDGGLEGLRLVLMVDLVLGPVLTLVFFHPEKPRKKLMLDVAVISLIQVAAMGWGAYQVWNQRPVAVVYGTERFTSVAPAIMKLQRRTQEQLQVYSDDKPPFVYRREPVGQREHERMALMIFRHGFHPESQAWLFQPFRQNLDKIFTNQKGFVSYLDRKMPAEWSSWVENQPLKSMDAYAFAFFEGRYKNAILVFTKDGTYRGYLVLGAVLPNARDKAAVPAGQGSVDKPH